MHSCCGGDEAGKTICVRHGQILRVGGKPTQDHGHPLDRCTVLFADHSDQDGRACAKHQVHLCRWSVRRNATLLRRREAGVGGEKRTLRPPELIRLQSQGILAILVGERDGRDSTCLDAGALDRSALMIKDTPSPSSLGCRRGWNSTFQLGKSDTVASHLEG
ncbi:MAG: hypothetical protein DWQ01_00495 [Planctomycetota bacterium]|nr:MAG: hypothetical protein DWQ01_00495 [Planctomycetota bacterium]